MAMRHTTVRVGHETKQTNAICAGVVTNVILTGEVFERDGNWVLCVDDDFCRNGNAMGYSDWFVNEALYEQNPSSVQL